MNDAIVHFTLGSTPIVSIFPLIVLSNAYSRMSDDEKEGSQLTIQTLCIALPVMYGLFFATLYSCLGIIPRKIQTTYVRFIVCGALASLCIGLILDYVFHVHEDWLHISNTYIFHIGTFLFYLCLFYTIGQWLRSQILYGPTPSSPPPTLASRSSSSPSKDSSTFDNIAIKAQSKK